MKSILRNDLLARVSTTVDAGAVPASTTSIVVEMEPMPTETLKKASTTSIEDEREPMPRKTLYSTKSIETWPDFNFLCCWLPFLDSHISIDTFWTAQETAVAAAAKAKRDRMTKVVVNEDQQAIAGLR